MRHFHGVRQSTKLPVFKINDTDQIGEVFYCSSCGAPVVNSGLGIKRHLEHTATRVACERAVEQRQPTKHSEAFKAIE